MRAQHCSKWTDGQILKTNRDGTFTVILDADQKKVVLPRANVRYHAMGCNPFQTTLDNKGRISMCVSALDTNSKGCNVYQARSSSSLSNGVWTNVAIVMTTNKRNEGGTMRLYIDGVVDAEANYNGKLLDTTESKNLLSICGVNDEFSTESMIKDVKVLAESLSTDQIIECMQSLTSPCIQFGHDLIPSRILNDQNQKRDPDTDSTMNNGASLNLDVDLDSKFSEEIDASENDVRRHNANELLQPVSTESARNSPNLVDNCITMPSSKCDDEAIQSDDISLYIGAKTSTPQDNDVLRQDEKLEVDNSIDSQAYREILSTLPSRINIAQKIAKQRAQIIDVAALSNLGPPETYIASDTEHTCQKSDWHLKQLLHKGATVNGRVGSRWYPGKVHAVNYDGSVDVCFDDNDFRPCVPSDRIKVCLDADSWVLAFDILKHSTAEMQEIRVLRRKSKKYMRRLCSNLQAGLQSLYAEQLALKILSRVSLTL